MTPTPNPIRTLAGCAQCAGAGKVKIVVRQIGTLTTYYELRCPTCRGVGVKAVAIIQETTPCAS